MTFRTRTAPQPSRRRTRRDDTRRGVIVTLTFSLVILIAVSLMGGVLLSGYYTQHWTPVAAVNGETISKDAVRNRVELNKTRYQRQIDVFTGLRNQTKISSDEFTNLTTPITSGMADSQAYSDALSQLEQEAELRQYASKNNIKVTDQQLTDQVKIDATVPELRHIKVIGVEPSAADPAAGLTQADLTAASTRAQALLDEVKNGKKWDDVAAEANLGLINSAEFAGSSTPGDLNLLSKDGTTLDADLTDAIFALAKVNDTTTLFKGSDGIYRFATVVTIVQTYEDPDWQKTVGGDAYNALVKDEALRKAIKDTVEAKYAAAPTVQRHVEQIKIQNLFSSLGGGDEVKFKLLVFAPNHSAANASSVASTDAAWTDAKKRADDAAAKLRQDPTQWTTMARDTTINDDVSGINKFSGDAPWLQAEWFSATMSSGNSGLTMPAVGAALFKDGLKAGTILDPILESASGYVLVEFDGRRGAPAQRIANAQLAINSGMSFEDAAKKYGESADALAGGDIGWVAQYTFTGTQRDAIWNTPVGSVSELVTINGDFYVFKVTEQQTRTLDAVSQAKLKKTLFTTWLGELKGSTLTWEDSAAMTALTPTAAP